MGSVGGKYAVEEDDVDSVESEDESVTMCEEVEEVEEEVVVEDKSVSVEEEEVEVEVESVESTIEIMESAVSLVDPKKRLRRGRRGKKASPSEPTEAIPAASLEVSSLAMRAMSPLGEFLCEAVKTSGPVPVTKPNAEPKPILKKADLHELVKREQILIHRLGTVGEVDRACFACGAVCKSRHQLNHHYGICAAFPRAYEKMDPNDRSWYMMIQYVRDDLAKASRLCMGCGSVFKTRHLLFEHNIRCEKAMTIDTWDRVTCFGLLYGTPYDDFAKFASKYKEPKKIPDYVVRVHTFVEDLKKTILKEKAEGRLAEERMKLLETERVEEYVKAQLKTKPEPEPEPEPAANPTISSEYIENCACEHCDRVKTYVPLQNPALKGVEREGYFVIPMVMDGYSTVLNNRRIYIPTQNVLLRIHDLGPA
jgi:hypothetical protein